MFKYIEKLKEFYREYLFTHPHLPFYSGIRTDIEDDYFVKVYKITFSKHSLSLCSQL